MAVLRLDLQIQNEDGSCIYDGIVETTSDLDTMAGSNCPVYNGHKTNRVSKGSAMVCLEDGKAYVKKIDGSWKAFGGEDGEEDEA